MISQKIEELLKPYLEENSPGYAVIIIKDQVPIYLKTVGYADIENKIAITQNTNFRLASVTKQFTAAAIMILINDAKLSLNDKITTFFPQFPDYGKDITIFELLTHTSGIIDYEDLIKNNETYQIHDEGVLELLMRQDHGYFTPGSSYKYSNGGYCLLKLIIEKVSGIEFSKFLQENIFAPIGMNNTVVNKEGITNIPHRAYGYSYDHMDWGKTDQDTTSATIGDGGIYSSLEDMGKWDQALYSSSPLSKKNLKDMFTEYVLADEDLERVYYGFGFCLKQHRGFDVEYHEGESIGFRNCIYRIPELKTSLIFLSNKNDGGNELLYQDIIDIVLESK